MNAFRQERDATEGGGSCSRGIDEFALVGIVLRQDGDHSLHVGLVRHDGSWDLLEQGN